MLTIIFDVNKSPNNIAAVNMAQEFLNAQVVIDTCWVKLPDSKIFDNIFYIKALSDKIQNYKSTRAYFHGKRVQMYKFAHDLVPIKECGLSVNSSKHCWKSNDTEGWGCKFLVSVSNHIPTKDNKSNRFWYNHGYFKGANWIIDKSLIKEILLAEAKAKGLSLCPFFKMDTLLKKIDELPDKIVIDNINYRIQYKQDFVDNKILDVPFNIEHIFQTTCIEHGSYKSCERYRYSDN